MMSLPPTLGPISLSQQHSMTMDINGNPVIIAPPGCPPNSQHQQHQIPMTINHNMSIIQHCGPGLGVPGNLNHSNHPSIYGPGHNNFNIISDDINNNTVGHGGSSHLPFGHQQQISQQRILKFKITKN